MGWRDGVGPHGKCGTLRLKREIDVSGWFETGREPPWGRWGENDGGGLSRITSEEDLASSLVLHV
jgi:hypothetical protein